MWDSLARIAALPFWQFMSAVILLWITQLIVGYFDRRNRIREERLRFYLSIVDHVAKIYRLAIGDWTKDLHLEISRETTTVILKLSILGSVQVMDALQRYTDYVVSLSGEAADERMLMRLASDVTYQMCCEIHGEKKQPRSCRE